MSDLASGIHCIGVVRIYSTKHLMNMVRGPLQEFEVRIQGGQVGGGMSHFGINYNHDGFCGPALPHSRSGISVRRGQDICTPFFLSFLLESHVCKA